MKFRRLLSVIAMLSIAGCNIQTPKTNTQPRESRSPIATAVPAKPKSEIKEATLIAVGDIMMHTTQTRSGYDAKKKTYSFDSFFAPVKTEGNIHLVAHSLVYFVGHSVYSLITL